MGNTTAVFNIKGGVGKTTTAGQLAHAGAKRGLRNLLVETDPQGNTTKRNTRYTDDSPPPVSLSNVLDVRNKDLTIDRAIVPSKREGIDVVPGGFGGLQKTADSLIGSMGQDGHLDRALAPIKTRYEHIIIDLRPASDLITRNALVTSDQLIIVVQPEMAAIDGVGQTMRTLGEMQTYLGKSLPISGFVINLIDRRRNDHVDNVELIESIAKDLGIPVLARIPMMADLNRLADVGMGLDETPTPNARTRLLSKEFEEIVFDHLYIRKFEGAPA